MIRKRLLSVSIALLAACGGGGGGSAIVAEPAAAAPKVATTSLIVVGNSISHMPPRPELGWAGDWGMAASSSATDFVHITAAALGLPARVVGGYQVEAGVTAKLDISASAADIVVVALGDNAGNGDSTFVYRYAELLGQVRNAGVLICMTTWWNDDYVNAVIEVQCPKAGGSVVNISDLYWLDRRPGGEQEFVASHPHDNSMLSIATRLIAEIRRH